MFFFLFNATTFYAQDYSKFYYPYLSYDFDKPATYVTQQFYPSNSNPVFQFHGTIMAQRVVDASTGKDPVQITVVDDMGNYVRSFLAFTDEDGEFVPTCAAYNSVTHRYCIAGIVENPSDLTGSTIGSWFMILSENGAYIDAKKMSVKLLSSTSSNNFFVSDITSSIDDQHSEFVFVGVAGQTNDPSPVLSGGPVKRTVYMGGLDSYSNVIAFTQQRAFDYAPTLGWSTNMQYFPSRIIELPVGSNNGGFLITGSGPQESIYFTRVHYNFTDNGLTQIYSHGSRLYAGDLYYDPAQSEVWFAGVQKEGDYNYYLYQKAVNLNAGGVGLFSNGASTCIPTPDIFLRYRNQYDPGSPTKISKIMPTDLAFEAVVASNTYNSSLYYASRTHTYPGLVRFNYSNNGLSLFCVGGSQYPDLYTYPRSVGNDGFDNYLPYLTYNKTFYPSHTAHELPYSTFNDNTYILGSSTYQLFTPIVPENIVLTRTTGYFINYCNYESTYLTSSKVTTVQTDVAPGDISYQRVGPAGLHFDTDINIDVNDCFNDNFFKQSIPLTKYDFNYKYHIDLKSNDLIIKSTITEGGYKLYNSMGQLLLKGSIHSGYALENVSRLPQGVYLLEIISDKHTRIGVQKLTKD